MQYAKKMVLVPQETIQKVHASNERSAAPTYKGLSGLDEQMQTILRRSDIPQDERIKLYQQALLGYINMHHKLNEPVTVKVETVPDAVSTETNAIKEPESMNVIPNSMSRWTERVKESVPKTLKRKAEQLMQLLQGDPSQALNVNEKGEVIVKGKTLEGTHIVDLINDALRRRKSFSPQGWREFANVLTALHPPRELIGNQDRWKIIQQLQGNKEAIPQKTGLKDDKEVEEKVGLYATTHHLPPKKERRTRKPTRRWMPY